MFLKKVFFRLIGGGLLTKAVQKSREEVRRGVAKLAIRVTFLGVLFMLGGFSMLFSMHALACYLNDSLMSSYQGYLLVSGGSLLLAFLLFLVQKILVRVLGRR